MLLNRRTFFSTLSVSFVLIYLLFPFFGETIRFILHLCLGIISIFSLIIINYHFRPSFSNISKVSFTIFSSPFVFFSCNPFYLVSILDQPVLFYRFSLGLLSLFLSLFFAFGLKSLFIHKTKLYFSTHSCHHCIWLYLLSL